jgi:hypothetical protein
LMASVRSMISSVNLPTFCNAPLQLRSCIAAIGHTRTLYCPWMIVFMGGEVDRPA